MSAQQLLVQPTSLQWSLKILKVCIPGSGHDLVVSKAHTLAFSISAWVQQELHYNK